MRCWMSVLKSSFFLNNLIVYFDSFSSNSLFLTMEMLLFWICILSLKSKSGETIGLLDCWLTIRKGFCWRTFFSI